MSSVPLGPGSGVGWRAWLWMGPRWALDGPYMGSRWALWALDGVPHGPTLSRRAAGGPQAGGSALSIRGSGQGR